MDTHEHDVDSDATDDREAEVAGSSATVPHLNEWIETVRNQQPVDQADPSRPKQAPVATQNWFPWAWLPIGLTTGFLVLGVILWRETERAHTTQGGPRVLHGSVVDTLGRPLSDAVIFLAHAPTVRTSVLPDGSFQLTEIPAGPQSFIVGVGTVGQEFQINVADAGITRTEALRYAAPPDH
jgi:hypothetical protein